MRFANPYKNYKTPTNAPEEYKKRTPTWLMPLNIGLIGLDFIVGLLPGFQAPAAQFLLAETTSSAIFGLSYGITGNKGTIWGNLLSFGTPFLGSGFQLFSNSRFLKRLDQQDLNLLKKNVPGLNVKHRVSVLATSSKFKTFKTKMERYSLDGVKNKIRIKNITKNFNINTNPLDMYAEEVVNYLKTGVKAWKNVKKKDFWNDFYSKVYKRTISDYSDKMERFEGNLRNNYTNIFDAKTFNKVNMSRKVPFPLTKEVGGLNQMSVKIPFSKLEQLEDIVDGLRRLGVSEETAGVLVALLKAGVNTTTQREQILEEFIQTLSLEESMLSKDFATLLTKIKTNFIAKGKAIEANEIWFRAWEDAIKGSPKRFRNQYGYDNPFGAINSNKFGSLRNIARSMQFSKRLGQVSKGIHYLNPSMVARLLPNKFFRGLVKGFRNEFKIFRKMVTKEKSIVDKTLNLAEKTASVIEKGFTKGAEALKRVKVGETIYLDSSWLLSISIIDPKIEESMYVLNFQKDATNGKTQVLIWATDKEFIELLEGTGAYYLATWAYSRGGRALKLGEIMGWGLGIGEALPLGKLHFPTSTIRKLLSIASNMKKTIDGRFIQKWEDPKKSLFQNFYLYSISRSSRYLSRNIFGDLLNKTIGNRLGRNLSTDFQQTIHHAIPMELSRMSTAFLAQPIRNLLQGKTAFNKNVLLLNFAKFGRDQSRFFLNARTPGAGTLNTLKFNRNMALFGRAAKIGGFNLNKKPSNPTPKKQVKHRTHHNISHKKHIRHKQHNKWIK